LLKTKIFYTQNIIDENEMSENQKCWMFSDDRDFSDISYISYISATRLLWEVGALGILFFIASSFLLLPTSVFLPGVTSLERIGCRTACFYYTIV